MPDYSRGKIYKLTNDIDDRVYVGSTTNKRLCNRIGKHRWNVRNGSACCVHRGMRAMGLEHWKILLLETYPCKSIEELTARENYWMAQFPKARLLNSKKAQFDSESYAKYLRGMADLHRQIVTCVCGTKIRKGNISRHTRTLKHRLFAAEHGLAVVEKKKHHSKQCPCGGRYIQRNKAQHEHSNKHKNWVEAQVT